MTNSNQNKRAGFTLMEMMMVIAIIGLFVTVFSKALPFLQEKTRDRRRVYELNNLRKVIEVYHADTGRYPIASGGFLSSIVDNDASVPTFASPSQITADYVPSIVPTYYEQLPKDPLPGTSSDVGCQALGYNRNIIYISDGEHYKLIYQCASEIGIDPADSFTDPARCIPNCYAWAVSDNMDLTTWGAGYGW